VLRSIQRNMSWRAVFIAGAVAGSVFLVTNIVLMPLSLGIDPSLSLRYIAALVLGNQILTQTDNTTLITVVGVIVHYVLSFVFTLIVAVVIHRWGILIGIIGGAVLGLALYGINLYTMTVFFSWFFALNNTVLLLSHVLFGAAAGGVYELFDHYDLPIEEKSK
jgi:MFS family permease